MIVNKLQARIKELTEALKETKHDLDAIYEEDDHDDIDSIIRRSHMRIDAVINKTMKADRCVHDVHGDDCFRCNPLRNG